jgi:four helix bundle protein
MASYRSFEDMEIWKKARELANKIYNLTLLGTFAKDYALKDQINKSSGSIMDNIAEGFERGGNKEFRNFLSYSKGSAGEVRSQLFRSLDRKHIDETTFNELYNETLVLGKMIGGFIGYLQTSEYKGPKFQEPEGLYLRNNNEEPD